MVEYETQVMRPADGRVASLPRPAVKLAHRLAQLANSQPIVNARIVIQDGEWHLYVERPEKLGEIDMT